MSSPAAPPALPASAGQALAMARAGLAWLARADAGSLTGAELAECLRGLERIESVRTAAGARVLAAFTARAGYEADGHGGPRPWLVWQTRVTRGAAGGALGWSRRLWGSPCSRPRSARRAVRSWARSATRSRASRQGPALRSRPCRHRACSWSTRRAARGSCGPTARSACSRVGRRDRGRRMRSTLRSPAGTRSRRSIRGQVLLS